MGTLEEDSPLHWLPCYYEIVYARWPPPHNGHKSLPIRRCRSKGRRAPPSHSSTPRPPHQIRYRAKFYGEVQRLGKREMEDKFSSVPSFSLFFLFLFRTGMHTRILITTFPTKPTLGSPSSHTTLVKLRCGGKGIYAIQKHKNKRWSLRSIVVVSCLGDWGVSFCPRSIKFTPI